MTEFEKEQWRKRRERDLLRKLSSQRNVALLTADRSVKDNEGTIIIDTAAANAADVTLPDPAKNLKRPIVVLNYSGASQNILSHAGSTIKVANTAAVGTHAIENASSATTGRRKFVASKDGTGTAYWWLTV